MGTSDNTGGTHVDMHPIRGGGGGGGGGGGEWGEEGGGSNTPSLYVLQKLEKSKGCRKVLKILQHIFWYLINVHKVLPIIFIFSVD